MAIMTLNGHVSRALDFYGRDDLYFGIGRTSAWADEKTPPIPEPTSVEI